MTVWRRQPPINPTSTFVYYRPTKTFDHFHRGLNLEEVCKLPAQGKITTYRGIPDMADNFIDRIYSTSGNDKIKAAYDDWADQYDDDLRSRNYLTPERVAQALRRFHTETSTPILDFGCGSGLSGTALHAVGFSNIDGADISEAMLDVARRKGLYKRLWSLHADQPLPFERGAYSVVTAAGAISHGAAPGVVYDQLLDILAPGAVFVFSLNDESRKMEEYAGPLRASLSEGRVRMLSEEHGPHFDHAGTTIGSTVYVVECLR